MSPVRVGIALISLDGRYLIRRRPPLPGSPMPGRWEFPGGKCEPGESPEGAAIRECHEETGMEVRVLRLRRSLEHHYPHGHVELHYFDCEPIHADAEPIGGFAWVAAPDLVGLDFPEANGPILRELAEAHRSSPPSIDD